MSTFPTDQVARLLAYYNDGAYDASTNPGGYAADGHRVNFVPTLQDIAAVTQYVGDAAGEVSDDAAATAAAAVYFLGAQASNPTTMRDGSALVAGAYYFNTGDSANRYYTGAMWITVATELPPNLVLWLDEPTEIDDADGPDQHSPYAATDGEVLAIDTSSAEVFVQLPATGFISFAPLSDTTVNAIVFIPPSGESIMGLTADEQFEWNSRYAPGMLRRRAGGDWRVY